MSKLTPGPWTVAVEVTRYQHKPDDVNVYITTADDNSNVAIASEIVDPRTMAPSRANANLMAAAPDLRYKLDDVITFAHSALSGTVHDDTLKEYESEVAALFAAIDSESPYAKP